MSTLTPEQAEMIRDLTDEQVTSIAKSLNWKDAPADKLRRTLNLNAKYLKVQEAVAAELLKVWDEQEKVLENPNTDMTEEEMERLEQEDPETGEWITDPETKAAEEIPAKEELVEECLDALAGVNMPNPLDQDHGRSFGMSEQAAAKYIEEKFGLTPRMAKRAIMRGINRDEYHGKGYVVKVVDTSEDSFDISVFAA